MTGKKGKPEIIVTDDGSHTLFHPVVGDHYHSTYGAISESRHIFIEAGLHFQMARSRQISILEVGFGTGLNAWLTCLEANKSETRVDYTAVEPYPLDIDLIRKLNYPDFVDDKMGKEIFFKIHEVPEGKWTAIYNGFSLNKIRSRFDEVILSDYLFNLVYFDSFAPYLQPELWTKGVFSKIYNLMQPGGTFVTYSTKGTVKRALAGAGFRMEKLPGPAGKREILRASKD